MTGENRLSVTVNMLKTTFFAFFLCISLGLTNVLCVDVRFKSDMRILAQEWFANRFNYAEFPYVHNVVQVLSVYGTDNVRGSTNVIMYTDEYTWVTLHGLGH